MNESEWFNEFVHRLFVDGTAYWKMEFVDPYKDEKVEENWIDKMVNDIEVENKHE